MTTRAASDDAIRAAGRDLARCQQPMSSANGEHVIGPLMAAVIHLSNDGTEKGADAA
jgi:hypothetical protein